ncbi:hypothetical protein [Acetobacter malorum]|uniref:hypothetical protein n=1 Tax=Acetobacter malorum TaxID=178901 RepID=UPI00248DA683|nr:hypothetical protein [Acetobacter malorum]
MKAHFLFFSAFSALLFAPASLPTAQAAGMFGGGTTLDASYCKFNPPRQTVVYVDDTDVVKDRIDWVKSLLAKLQQTLMPGERTTVVELSPQHGQSKEIWSACWPNVSAAEAKKLTSESHFFSGNPLDSLKEQQGFFARDFGQAITKIYVSSQRAPAEVEIDPENPPKKSIIRSLASDGARYANAHGTIRSILYSDMAENSELGSVFKTPVPASLDLDSKLGTYLHRSIFYVFGAGSTVKDDGKVSDNIRKFWAIALQSMAANVGGFGSDLGIANVIPLHGATFEVTLKENSDELHGHLFLMMDTDGQLVDSWIGITRLRSAAINGSLRCSENTTQCTLNAKTNSPLVTDSTLETLSLKQNGSSSLFDNGGSMQGTLGVPGSNVNLPLSAKLVDEE